MLECSGFELHTVNGSAARSVAVAVALSAHAFSLAHPLIIVDDCFAFVVVLLFFFNVEFAFQNGACARDAIGIDH